jgi:hypothetical protein
MKTAGVKKLKLDSACPSLEIISELLDDQKDRLQIDTINWKGFDYKPEVELSIGYGDFEIFLKFYVREDYFKAEKTETNQMVCEDSCVEFFVSPEDDGTYYNIEFNGIGTCLAGYGTGRKNSTRLNPEMISKIRRITTAGDRPVKERTGKYEWSLTTAIPIDLFFKHKVTDLKGKSFRANFYKCGDKLTIPHYLTWNPVGTEKPDYHQPKYFGLLKFI